MYQQAIEGTGRVAAMPLADVPPAPTMSCAWPLGRLSDRVISSFSQVPLTPVLDMRGFGWTCALRDSWQAIRGEADANRLAQCPETAAAIAQVPGLYSAGFVRIAPGTHVSAHRGATRGLLTCDLGLIVPRDGDPRMRVGDRIVRWAEGETLVFDDTCPHEMWNDAQDAVVVLRLGFRRPLRQPGRWIADLLLGLGR